MVLDLFYLTCIHGCVNIPCNPQRDHSLEEDTDGEEGLHDPREAWRALLDWDPARDQVSSAAVVWPGYSTVKQDTK